MRRRLKQEIEGIKKQMLSLGGRVEEAINKAITAVFDRNRGLGEEVMLEDKNLDVEEVRIEEECIRILALYSPVASELRFIIAVIKITNDIERIGDLAVNISGRAISLSLKPPIPHPEDLKRFRDHAIRMLKLALDSFVSADSNLALKVVGMDEEADRIHRRIAETLQAQIKSSPDESDRLLSFLSTSRWLERICDHATNIAEDVHYMVHGDIIRHAAKEKAKKAVPDNVH